MTSSVLRARGGSPRFAEVVALVFAACALTTASGRGGAAGEGGDAPPASRRLTPASFRLVGGWRLAQEYPRGGLAIDFDKGRVFMGGHAQRQEVVEFSLMRRNEETGERERIAPGTGEDVMQWPRLDPVKVHLRPRDVWGSGVP
ncbi:MAG: hypothetical protein ACODAJ_11275 [Planctomycetota bacterium]